MDPAEINNAPVRKMPFHVMAKPNGSLCNLDCKYCYYLEKENLFPDTKQFRMPEDVLRRFVENYIASQDALGVKDIMFAWQGGEPTIAGLDYFKSIVELQDEFCPQGKKISNAFQTNGILINEEWAKFFKENDFLVGLSIDGPADLHDIFRVDKAGHPSFEKVMKAVRILNAHAVMVTALCTVSRHNSRRPLDVYRFLKEAGFEYIQFIPIVERTIDGENLAGAPQQDERGIDAYVTPWSVLPRDYGNFLNTIFDEWLKEDVGKVSVQLFDVQRDILMGYPASLCWYSKTCGWGLAMEHNGNLYSCDHYVYPEYLLGNIKDKSIEELVYSPEQAVFGNDKRDLLPPDCISCEIRFACHGGCPKHRILKPKSGENGLNYYCRSFKMFHSHAAPYLKYIGSLQKQGQTGAQLNEVLKRNLGAVKMRIGGIHRVGRNTPCPCGSGKKFKYCCGAEV
ncbi:anaerobic sulfatase maturase [Pseudovibrio sp. Tun.PSC04-5.I4]|uniref:anaerobic sulfatase maturase n=1 Tax=Pseudovibrio sp. Tun.PSC04-5.I4 TaxID=1798213 RepID=UPI00088B9DF7|nr:anaerobic sulfatase maturase [Pseudovibrio sp. Tun.PSC04-5.I4]SDQ74868.1 uncharacterized protein SAMN04515695_1247 [Pseudovibrio sp. Tun.PSC04-5.I4]